MSTQTCLVLITIFICFAGTNALKCYNCTSKIDSNCGETLTNKKSLQTVECGSGGQCAKIDANIQIGDHSDEFFTRMCIPLCTEVCSPTPGGEMCSYCCGTDLCNSGLTLVPFVGPLIASFVAGLIFVL